MKTINQSSNDKLFIARALEATIQIGLVVGAIILALGYKLFLAWLNEGTQPELELRESE